MSDTGDKNEWVLLRGKDADQMVGQSQATRYERINAGLFPKLFGTILKFLKIFKAAWSCGA